MITARDLSATLADRAYQLREQTRHLIRKPSVERYRGGTRSPVLLIPGVYETWQFLRPIGDRLHGLGHPVHLLTELGYNRFSIADSAALAQRYLENQDLRDVTIIGHSKGGLIGKHMMVSDDASGRIARLLAVNSPFVGSSLARWAPNRTLRAFSPTDRTVRTLAVHRSANSRIVSIYSRLDPLIPAGSMLEGATNIELPIVGHFTPLSSPLLFAEIERALTH